MAPLVHAVKCPAVAGLQSCLYVFGGFTQGYSICNAIQVYKRRKIQTKINKQFKNGIFLTKRPEQYNYLLLRFLSRILLLIFTDIRHAYWYVVGHFLRNDRLHMRASSIFGRKSLSLRRLFKSCQSLWSRNRRHFESRGNDHSI